MKKQSKTTKGDLGKYLSVSESAVKQQMKIKVDLMIVGLHSKIGVYFETWNKKFSGNEFYEELSSKDLGLVALHKLIILNKSMYPDKTTQWRGLDEEETKRVNYILENLDL